MPDRYIPLGVLMKNASKTEDMIEILDVLHKYVHLCRVKCSNGSPAITRPYAEV